MRPWSQRLGTGAGALTPSFGRQLLPLRCKQQQQPRPENSSHDVFSQGRCFPRVLRQNLDQKLSGIYTGKMYIYILHTKYIFKTIFFQSRLRVISKLKSRYRDFPYTPCPHTRTALPIIIAHQNGTLFTKDEPTETHHNHPKSIFYLRLHSWRCTRCGLKQMYKVMYPSLQHHTEYFRCPKNPPCSV